MPKKSCLLVIVIALVSSFQALARAETSSRFRLPSAAGMFQKFCADEGPLFKAKIAFTEAKLSLQPAQRQSWDDFVAEAFAAAQPIRTLCKESPATADSNPVEELDFREKATTAFLETNRALTTAAKKFITALNSEQQRAFADSFSHPFSPMPLFSSHGPRL